MICYVNPVNCNICYTVTAESRLVEFIWRASVGYFLLGMLLFLSSSCLILSINTRLPTEPNSLLRDRSLHSNIFTLFSGFVFVIYTVVSSRWSLAATEQAQYSGLVVWVCSVTRIFCTFSVPYFFLFLARNFRSLLIPRCYTVSGRIPTFISMYFLILYMVFLVVSSFRSILILIVFVF